MADIKKTADDFIFGKLIGEGSFSTVYLGKDVTTKKEFAIKVCEKKHIKKEKKTHAIMREKIIMKILTDHPSPYFIKLYCTFQDNERLYFVMNYARHGELLPFITKVGSFDEECTRFYGGEVLMALEHLHKLSIIHRDLKPENILLNELMHIQITDFGSACLLSDSSVSNNSEHHGSSSTNTNNSINTENVPPKRKNSFVGTAHYVSPDVLTNKTPTTSLDLWAFGCILYQMIAGLPPFRAANEYLIFQKINNLDYDFPDGFNETAKCIIQKLLRIDPNDRLGAQDDLSVAGYSSIKQHPFFTPMKDRWQTLHEEIPPRLMPYLPGTSENEELRSSYGSLDNLEPGFAEKQLTRLLGLSLRDESDQQVKKSILDISPHEMKERLEIQKKENIWHRFVQDNLIVKQGLIDKRKGLFARRRMLLLTTGPHLYYVDPSNMVLKGQIPWSSDMHCEVKNFKHFFVHTPNRTYFLEDPEGHSPEWCRVIEEVRFATYGNELTTNATTKSNTKNKNPSRKTSMNDKKF